MGDQMDRAPVDGAEVGHLLPNAVVPHERTQRERDPVDVRRLDTLQATS